MTTAAVFDIIGIIAFAFSGAIVGIIKRMDIFGITVLAVLTAVGGGILRDVLVGIIPPTTLVHPYGFILSILTSLFVCFLFETVKFSRKGKRIIAIVYNISDTLGLASFTVTGAVTGLTLYPESSIILPVTLGLITAIGGGIFRDILAHRVPVVLKTDFYAFASILGGILIVCLWEPLGSVIASWSCFLFVTLLRVLAIRYGWQLHHPRPKHIYFKL